MLAEKGLPENALQPLKQQVLEIKQTDKQHEKGNFFTCNTSRQRQQWKHENV